MIINLNVPFKDLKGEPVPDSNMGKLLAERLANSQGLNAIDLFQWSLDLFQKGEVDLDASKFNILRSIVDSEKLGLSVAAQAQLLLRLDSEIIEKRSPACPTPLPTN